MKKGFNALVLLFVVTNLSAQLVWQNVDSLFQPLPKTVHVFYTDTKADTAPFRAYYVIADLKDKKTDFTADTTYKRRLTPIQFYEKNYKPLLVVNCTFFSFETNQNLNVVIKEGEQLSYNRQSMQGKGRDSLHYWHFFRSAIGISKKGKSDIVWVYSDSSDKYAHHSQVPLHNYKDEFSDAKFPKSFTDTLDGREVLIKQYFPDWKVRTAVGGGPVLLQKGEIRITNEEEMMFTGKAINDKHPRTAMGYTKDNKLIILVVEGRNPTASGATLTPEAQLLKDLGCWEALNLDGGGSSCLLINGKETIKPSDKSGQRPVPAVFIIRTNK